MSERRINRRKDDYCNYCGGFSKIRNDNSLFCLECEQKFVKKYKNIQELSHEEKLKAFYLDTEKEIKETGNVVYSQEILDLDLLELELQKTINVPNKYKLENIK